MIANSYDHWSTPSQTLGCLQHTHTPLTTHQHTHEERVWSLARQKPRSTRPQCFPATVSRVRHLCRRSAPQTAKQAVAMNTAAARILLHLGCWPNTTMRRCLEPPHGRMAFDTPRTATKEPYLHHAKRHAANNHKCRDEAMHDESKP